MRKEDRIANQQQNRSQQPSDQQPQQEPTEREQVKGSESVKQAPKPPRQAGKLPLPD